MKRLIFLFSLLIIVIGSKAQTGKSYAMAASDIYFNYTGVAADTVGLGTTEWTQIIIPNKVGSLMYDLKIKVLETSGTARDSIIVQGRKFPADSWTNLGSVVKYIGTGTDTTVWIVSNTTAVYYREFRAYLKRTAGTSKVSYLQWLFRVP